MSLRQSQAQVCVVPYWVIYLLVARKARALTRKGTMHELHCMSWNRCSKGRHATPCDVEGAWLSAWRLAKAARLSVVLVFCVSQLNSPSSWRAVFAMLDH